MPIRERPIQRAPAPSAMSSLGKHAMRFGTIFTDPLKAAWDWTGKKLPGVAGVQESLEAPRLDDATGDIVMGDGPIENFDAKPRLTPVRAAQFRGGESGLLEQANYGNVIPAAGYALKAAKTGIRGIQSLSALARASGLLDRGIEAANVANKALDYGGMAIGGADVIGGAASGDTDQIMRGVVTGGMSGVSRYLDQPRREPLGFWNDASQQRPERPAQTPLEAKDSALVDLFDAGPAVHPEIAAELETRRGPAPAFEPKKPRLGQQTLQAADQAPIEADSSGLSVAERARRARLLNPKQQDSGIISAARPSPDAALDDTAALDEFMRTGRDPLAAAPIDPPAPIPEPATVEPDVFDLGELDTATQPVTVDPERRKILQGLAQDGTLKAPEPDLMEMIARRRNNAAAADAVAPQGDSDAAGMLQTLLERIAAQGGIRSMDDQILARTRNSFRPQDRASGELARVKEAGGKFGRFGNVRGVWTKGGAPADRVATDFIRQYPEYAGKFESGDGLLQFIDDLNTKSTFRAAPVRPRMEINESAITQGVRDARREKLQGRVAEDTDLAATIAERTAARAAEGDTSFDITALEGDAPAPAVDPDRRKILQSFVNDGEPDIMDIIAGRRAARPPVVDTLPNGEAQPRLPGDTGAVRDIEAATPTLARKPEETFDLKPPPVKPPVQPGLPESLPADVPTQAAAPEVAPAVVPDGNSAPAALPRATVPGNVQAFLTKQLGYTPEAVAAMTPEQAITIGRAKTPPEGAAAAVPKPAAPPGSAGAIVQESVPLSTRNVPIRGKKPVGVNPVDVTDAAPLSGGKSRVDVDMAALKAAAGQPAETGPAPVQTAREKGTNPRARERANSAGQKFVETGDEASLNSWAASVANEAQKAGEGAVKAGFKTSLDGAPKISSNPMFDPDMWVKVGRELAKTPAGRFYMGAVGGAIVGHEQDDPWSETAKDAIMGGLAASAINKNTARNVMSALDRMRTGQGIYGERGVRAVLPDAAKEWSAWDRFASPQRAIPDVMRKVQPQFERAEQALRGFDAQGNPIKNFAAEKYLPSELKLEPEAREEAWRQRKHEEVKVALRDTRATLREEGKRLWEAGEKEKAKLVREMLARIDNRPTVAAQLFESIGLNGKKTDSVLAKLQYFQSLAWNFGVGKILNPTQKYFALNYVPFSAINKAKKILKTPEGRARTDFLHIDRAADDPAMLDLDFMENLGSRGEKAKTLWSKIMEKTGKNALTATDEQNRRVVYLAASDYAKAKGGVQTGKGFDASPEAIHRWAMDVVGQTQSVVGPMGQSPYISRLGKSATTFTKFATLSLELALEVANNPRPETLGLVAVAASMAMANKALPDDYELDLMKMFAPRAVVGFTSEGIPKPPAAGQATNFWNQLTNDTQPLPERLLRAATPDAPERYYDEIFGEGGFLDSGTGPHRHPNRYGSLDEHSGYDALARLFGVETAKNSDRIVASQQQRNFQKRTVKESAANSRPARQSAKIDRLRRSKPGESAKDDIRRGVPVKSRRAYDERFGGKQ